MFNLHNLNGYAFNDKMRNRIAIQRNAFGGGVEVLELKDNEWVQSENLMW